MTIGTAERDALRDFARQELARRTSLDFNARIDPEFDRNARHTQVICEHLDALANRDIENLIVCMPPQHGKSTFTAQRFPAYLLGRSRGRALVATTSYTIAIARKNSRAARNIVKERASWPFPDVEIARGAQSVDEWYTTAGGGVKAAGVGGSLTGFGAHLAVIDDPFKGMAEADRLTERDTVWEWYQTTVSTRARKGMQKLVCQTRWHDDDLTGRILNTKAARHWTVLTLRSYAEEDDILGRAIGELLWPEGPRPLSVAEGEITARGFAALYQQRPMPGEGAIFRIEFFENRYNLPPEVRWAAIALDGAWKTGVGNDRSALAFWTANDQRYAIRRAWAGRLEYPDLKRKFVDFYERARAEVDCAIACVVEDAASGTGVIQELSRTTNIPILGVHADVSKIARAEAVSPLFEAKKVELPQEADWVDEWIEEHVRFPAGKRDDWVDTSSLALARLSRRRKKSTLAYAIAKNHR